MPHAAHYHSPPPVQLVLWCERGDGAVLATAAGHPAAALVLPAEEGDRSWLRPESDAYRWLYRLSRTAAAASGWSSREELRAWERYFAEGRGRASARGALFAAVQRLRDALPAAVTLGTLRQHPLHRQDAVWIVLQGRVSPSLSLGSELQWLPRSACHWCCCAQPNCTRCTLSAKEVSVQSFTRPSPGLYLGQLLYSEDGMVLTDEAATAAAAPGDIPMRRLGDPLSPEDLAEFQRAHATAPLEESVVSAQLEQHTGVPLGPPAQRQVVTLGADGLVQVLLDARQVSSTRAVVEARGLRWYPAHFLAELQLEHYWPEVYALVAAQAQAEVTGGDEASDNEEAEKRVTGGRAGVSSTEAHMLLVALSPLYRVVVEHITSTQSPQARDAAASHIRPSSSSLMNLQTLAIVDAARPFNDVTALFAALRPTEPTVAVPMELSADTLEEFLAREQALAAASPDVMTETATTASTSEVAKASPATPSPPEVVTTTTPTECLHRCLAHSTADFQLMKQLKSLTEMALEALDPPPEEQYQQYEEHQQQHPPPEAPASASSSLAPQVVLIAQGGERLPISVSSLWRCARLRHQPQYHPKRPLVLRCHRLRFPEVYPLAQHLSGTDGLHRLDEEIESIAATGRAPALLATALELQLPFAVLLTLPRVFPSLPASADEVARLLRDSFLFSYEVGEWLALEAMTPSLASTWDLLWWLRFTAEYGPLPYGVHRGGAWAAAYAEQRVQSCLTAALRQPPVASLTADEITLWKKGALGERVEYMDVSGLECFGDEELALLLEVCPRLCSLNLDGTGITGLSVQRLCEEGLCLRQCSVERCPLVSAEEREILSVYCAGTL